MWLATGLENSVSSTEEFWASPSGTAYRVSARRQIGATAMLVTPLDQASQAYARLASALRDARADVGEAIGKSVALGMGPRDLIGNPLAVMGFVATHPQQVPVVAMLLGEIVGARLEAGRAHTAFTASITGARDALDGADERLRGREAARITPWP